MWAPMCSSAIAHRSKNRFRRPGSLIVLFLLDLLPDQMGQGHRSDRVHESEKDLFAFPDHDEAEFAGGHAWNVKECCSGAVGIDLVGAGIGLIHQSWGIDPL